MARRNLPSPFSPHRIRGCSILFSLYTISGDFFPWDRPFPWGILNQPPPLQAFRAPGLPQYHIYCGTSRIHLFFHPHNTPFLYKKRFPCFLYRKADICFDYPSISSPISRAYWSNSFSVQKKFMAFQHGPAQLEISSRQKESAYKPFGQCFTHSPPFISKRTSFPHTAG